MDDLVGAAAASFSEGDWFVMDGLACRWSATWGPVLPAMYAAPGTGYNPGSGATAHKWNIQHRWQARDIDPDTEVTAGAINTLTANVGNVGGALSGPAGNEAQYNATGDPLGGPAIQVTKASSQELQIANVECFNGLDGALIYVFGKMLDTPSGTNGQIAFVSQGDNSTHYRMALSYYFSHLLQSTVGNDDASSWGTIQSRAANTVDHSPWNWGGHASLIQCPIDLGAIYHSDWEGFDESGQHNVSAAFSNTDSLLIRIGGGPGGFVSMLIADILLIGAPHNTHNNVTLLDRLHLAKYGLLGA